MRQRLKRIEAEICKLEESCAAIIVPLERSGCASFWEYNSIELKDHGKNCNYSKFYWPSKLVPRYGSWGGRLTQKTRIWWKENIHSDPSNATISPSTNTSLSMVYCKTNYISTSLVFIVCLNSSSSINLRRQHFRYNLLLHLSHVNMLLALSK